MNGDEHQLWRVGLLSCVMVSCCSGAELQLRRARSREGPADFDITLRELYPTKSDLYERARELEVECRARSSVQAASREGGHASEA